MCIRDSQYNTPQVHYIIQQNMPKLVDYVANKLRKQVPELDQVQRFITFGKEA